MEVQECSMVSLNEYAKNFSDKELAEGVKIPRIVRWRTEKLYKSVLTDTEGDTAHMSDCFVQKQITDKGFTIYYKDSNSSCLRLRKRYASSLPGYTYGFYVHIESSKNLYFIPTDITQKEKRIGKFKISARWR